MQGEQLPDAWMRQDHFELANSHLPCIAKIIMLLDQPFDPLPLIIG